MGSIRFKGFAGLFVASVLASGTAFAQAPANAAPAFEVASIKPAALAALTPQAIQSGQVRLGLTVTGGRVDIGFFSLADLIRTAYNVKAFQVSGPDWLTTTRFDIAAKLPDGATKDDVNGMLQTLLKERFGLVVHREKKDHPVYALVVHDASKLKPSVADADAPKKDETPLMTVNGQSVGPITQTANGFSATVSGGPSGPVKISMTASGEHIEATTITMPALADMLTPMLERPIVDMTELQGTYQVAIDIPLQELMAAAQRAAASMGISMPAMPGGGIGGPFAASDPGGGASIFESVQQAGLKLESRNAPVDVIVVDSVSKIPTEN